MQVGFLGGAFAETPNVSKARRAATILRPTRIGTSRCYQGELPNDTEPNTQELCNYRTTPVGGWQMSRSHVTWVVTHVRQTVYFGSNTCYSELQHKVLLQIGRLDESLEETRSPELILDCGFRCCADPAEEGDSLLLCQTIASLLACQETI